ncbi:Testis-Expressed Protein 13A [Manis pentadactyla]|nr:Testis-Expressed Protein 13A [Manis pentadactyla]
MCRNGTGLFRDDDSWGQPVPLVLENIRSQGAGLGSAGPQEQERTDLQCEPGERAADLGDAWDKETTFSGQKENEVTVVETTEGNPWLGSVFPISAQPPGTSLYPQRALFPVNGWHS